MTSLLPHRPLLATALIAALLGGSLTAGVASAATDETTTVGLAGAALPALVADSNSVAMIASQGDMVLDPSLTVFTADRDHEAISTLAMDASALPDNVTVSEANLTYEVTSTPGEGAVVAVQIINVDGTRADWPAGEPRNSEGSGAAQLGWTFDSAGRYTVTVTAALTVGEETVPGDEQPTNEGSNTPASPNITGDGSSAGTPVALTTDYTFDVSESAAPLEEPSATTSQPGTSDAQSPMGTTDSVQQDSPIAGTDTAVVSEGDIRVTTTVVDRQLAQGLADFTTDTNGAPLDPATTVLVVPQAETWPGANGAEDTELWSLIAPDQGQVWRTSTDGLTANPLTLSVDSSGIEPGTLYSYFGSIGIPEGGLFTRLGQITGPASAALLGAGRSNAGTSLQAGDDAPWSETGPLGDAGVIPSQWPFAAAFTESGRYCVTLQSNAQLSGTGTVLNNDLTLTFAVGDTDPATVEPCAQPPSIASQAPTPVPSGAEEVTVIDSGVALLGSTLTDGALSLDVVTTDRGLTTSYDPSEVVFSLQNRDNHWPGTGAPSGVQENWARYLPEEARAYRSAGRYILPGQNPSDERANGLTLDLDARFINANDVPDGGVNYDFEGATTTSDTGYMFTYRTDTETGVSSAENIGFWNSQPGGDRLPQWVDAAADWGDPFYTPNKERNGEPALGVAFSSGGVYCVTLKTSTTLASGTTAEDRATFTFAVGVDARAVTPCSQESGEPGGGGEGPGEEPEELDPTVRWMQQGHVDLALRDSDDGSLEFATGDPKTVGMHQLEDAVWVSRGAYSTYTVREPTSFDDRTFIGPVGTTYYGFSATPENVSRTLWPGLSMLHLPVGVTNRNAAWTLQKVSGPGDVFSWTAGTTYLNSREQESTAFDLGHTHVHQNWAFTEAGVYCLAVSARLRTADDESHDKTASELLTVAVGDVDLSTVQPCARTQEVPPAPAPAPVTLSSEPTVIGNSDFARELQLTSVDGDPDVVVSVTERVGDAPVYVDPEHVVYSPRQVADRYQFDARWRTLPHELPGNVVLALGAVAGPGDYYMTGNRVDDQAVQLDTRAGQEQSHEALWPGYGFPSVHRFTAEGIYCVPFTWTGTTETGESFKLTKILTFAAGVDPSGVTPCADGGVATDPGEGPDPDPVAWDVPNHTETDSGATIITTGHIDIASQLAGGRLATTIKDGSNATKPIAYRSPADTVLQVRPEAETTVPADTAYSFLGSAGTSTWLLPAAEQSGLLWPGWSTEELPQSATTRGVDWTLTEVSGPGEFALYQTPFSGPKVLFDTRDGITAEDSFEIPKNTHAHAAWAFSAEGTYCVAFTRSTALASGEGSSDSFTLAFAVGVVDVKKIDPTKCFTKPEGQPTDPDTAPFPVSDLTEDNAGEVRVLGGQSGFTPGQLLTVQLDNARAGNWVSVWLDDTAWLGWVQAGSSGAVQVRLPANAVAGSHALIIKNRVSSLLGWDSLSIVKADHGGGEEPGGGTDPVPDGAWNVPNGTVNATGATVLNNGHVDIASLVENGRLVTKVKDTSETSDPVWRPIDKTVLQLLPSSKAVVPAAQQWAFLGKPGASFYQVAQTQQPGLLWPGWSTESIPLTSTTGGVVWALVDVSGPGEFALYENGPLGQPSVFFNTRDGIDKKDRFTIPKNTHAHGSWAFSAQGNYCLSMQRTTELTGGNTTSDTFVVAVAVGTADVTQIDPAKCDETVNTDPIDIAPPKENSDPSRPPTQEMAAQQCVAGATILSAGHIDFATRIVGGKIESLLGEDTSGTKVYREPSGTILWLKPSSRVILPGGYGQVGPAGSSVWQVPQTQQSDLIWLGWNTESLNSGNTRGPVTWTIDSIDGPGSVKVYQGGSFGGVQQMQFNNGGSYQIPQGVHAHANWAFSTEGIYRITMTQTATLTNGQASSDTETLTIAVGDVDPASAASGGSGCGTVSNAMLLSDEESKALVAADQAAADAAAAARDRLPGRGSDVEDGIVNPFEALADGDPVPLLLSILGVLLLVGAAGSGILWWRRKVTVESTPQL